MRNLAKVVDRDGSLKLYIGAYKETETKPQDTSGGAEIAMAAGHEAEPTLPGTFVDHDLEQRIRTRSGGPTPDDFDDLLSKRRDSQHLLMSDLTSSAVCLRTGADNEGVIGVRQTGLPDEVAPGLSARFMGIKETAVIDYLVSTYYSAEVLVPDALGVLEDCQGGG